MAADIFLPPHHQPQRARVSMRLGKRARLSARVEVTSDGLRAIGGLVSSILLSSAVLVAVAATTARPRRDPPRAAVAHDPSHG